MKNTVSDSARTVIPEMPNHDPEPVIIVGGGWAGLSAAVHLVANGQSVRLFESARQFGGRARCVPFSEHTVDNGQHLLLGAYSEALNIMRTCNTDINSVLLRQPLVWKVKDSLGKNVQLRIPRLPAPFNFMYGIIRAQGYSLSERLQTLRFMYALQRRGFSLDADTSVATLLEGQPAYVIQTLWEPLCLAALNSPINIASAQIFLNVIRDSFTRHARDADALFTIRDLGQVFVRPAIEFIESKGSQVHLAQRVDALNIDNDTIHGVRIDGENIPASSVIVATSLSGSQRLLAGHERLAPISETIRQLTYQPICTVYLQYPAEIALSVPMLGLNRMTGQWLFDRRFANQPGLMAVVISADGPHTRLDTETLAQLISDEFTEYFGWPEPQRHLVLREKRATFSACVDVNALRPDIATPIDGLWLAGDYTCSPYPSTLEGAVRSGVQCAQKIIQQTKRTPA